MAFIDLGKAHLESLGT